MWESWKLMYGNWNLVKIDTFHILQVWWNRVIVKCTVWLLYLGYLRGDFIYYKYEEVTKWGNIGTFKLFTNVQSHKTCWKRIILENFKTYKRLKSPWIVLYGWELLGLANIQLRWALTKTLELSKICWYFEIILNILERLQPSSGTLNLVNVVALNNALNITEIVNLCMELRT